MKTKSRWIRLLSALSSRPRFLLYLLVPIAVYGVVAGSNEPIIPVFRGTRIEELAVRLHWGNEIVFALSVGFLTGVFVWYLLAWLPERRMRKIIRTNLHRRYNDFKRQNMRTLLAAAGRTGNEDTIDSICGHYKAFREVFDADDKKSWYDAMNGIADETKPYLADILVEYQILADEFNYATNHINIEDDEVHSFARRLLEIVFRLRNYNWDRHDLERSVGRYLFQIYAWWSFVDGQRDSDFVEEMINRI